MHYPYTQRNLLRETENYMYPPFWGWDFVHSYRAARNTRILELEQRLSGIDPSCCLLDILLSDRRSPLPEPDSTRLLQALEGLGTRTPDTPARPDASLEWLARMTIASLTEASMLDRAHLLGLIRRFEISKRLPERLEAPGYPLWGAPVTDVVPYALLASLLGRLQGLDGDLRVLNCLLKLGDLMCSLPPDVFQTPQELGHALLGLRYEFAGMAFLLGDDDDPNA